jgi:MFS family permease
MATIHRWRAFAVLAVAYFMTIVDLTIVNRIFVIGLAVFTAASLACGLARGDGLLIVTRGIQGAG